MLALVELIETEERARRLARTIASDIVLYNRERPTPGADLSGEIAEGRSLFYSRVAPTLHWVFDQVLEASPLGTGKPAEAPAAAQPPSAALAALMNKETSSPAKVAPSPAKVAPAKAEPSPVEPPPLSPAQPEPAPAGPQPPALPAEPERTSALPKSKPAPEPEPAPAPARVAQKKPPLPARKPKLLEAPVAPWSVSPPREISSEAETMRPAAPGLPSPVPAPSPQREAPSPFPEVPLEELGGTSLQTEAERPAAFAPAPDISPAIVAQTPSQAIKWALIVALALVLLLIVWLLST
ncbi:MAG TPA: hypothetical protein VK524_17560 [Polyangiaceae bacterium]|nr:hypothetical protein [Polyangiaceae bacterium]